MDISAYVTGLCQEARAASKTLAAAKPGVKSRALQAIAGFLEADREALKKANALDLEQAESSGLAQPLVDRLVLNDAAIDQMITGVLQVDKLSDPVGAITDLEYRPTGIQVGKMRIPLGVIGIIYESRPNVTIDAASLCLKAGNACILRGGSEAIHSNKAISASIDKGLEDVGLPKGLIQVIETTDRGAVGALLTQDEYVDVIVPRGGRSLIERVSRESKIPVIKHLDGICHVYIDDSADIEMAIAIAVNAKTEKYAVCNAMETLLVARSVAEKILPLLAQQYAEHNVELRGCEITRGIITAQVATEQDWAEEYLAPILAVRVVENIDAALVHIDTYGSHNTDAIVCNDYRKSQRFLTEVDSASVMVNASTQFADGFEYGLGAEVGISTNKLHVRGPVGLEGLTTQKFVVLGNGEIRHR